MVYCTFFDFFTSYEVVFIWHYAATISAENTSKPTDKAEATWVNFRNMKP